MPRARKALNNPELEAMRAKIPRSRTALVKAAKLSKHQRELQEACDMKARGESLDSISEKMAVTKQTLAKWWNEEFAIRYLYELTREQLTTLETGINVKLVRYVPDALDVLHEIATSGHSEKNRVDASTTLARIGIEVVDKWKKMGSADDSQSAMEEMRKLIREQSEKQPQVNVQVNVIQGDDNELEPQIEVTDATDAPYTLLPPME